MMPAHWGTARTAGFYAAAIIAALLLARLLAALVPA